MVKKAGALALFTKNKTIYIINHIKNKKERISKWKISLK